MADNKLSAQVTIDTNPAVASLGKLNKSVKGSAETLAKLKPSAAAGGSALLDFNRIVQDAPFGLVGITNNITELGDSFGRLKEQTGSGKAAFKSMIQSLSGAGGIGLAISAVTTALTFASVGFGAWTRGLDKMFESNDKAKASAEEYKKSLEAISNSLGEEASRVSVLVNAIESETLTRKERLGAIKELQRINPQYFGDLKDEKGLVDDLKIAYNGYINSLKEQFAAKALDKKIADLFSKKVDLEVAIDQGSASRAAKDLGGISKVEAARFAELLKKPFLELTAEEDKFIKKIQSRKAKTNLFDFSDDQKNLKDIDRQIDELLNKRTELGQFDIAPDLKEGGKDKLKKTIQRFLIESEFELPLNKITLPKGNTGQIDIPVGISIEPISTDAHDVAGAAIRNVVSSIEDQAKNTGVDLNGIMSKPMQKELDAINSLITDFESKGLTADSFITNEAVQEAAKRLAAIAKFAVDLTKQIKAAFAQFEADALGGLGEAIGSAIASGGEGLRDAAQNIGNMFGSFLKQLGKIMIQTGVLALAAKKAMAALFSNPVAAIAVGVGLTALGQIVTQKLSATKFATGGIVTGPTLGMVGEAGQPEVILPLSKINQFMDQGQGGGGSLTLAVDFNKFIFGVNRGNRRNNRLF